MKLLTSCQVEFLPFGHVKPMAPHNAHIPHHLSHLYILYERRSKYDESKVVGRWALAYNKPHPPKPAFQNEVSYHHFAAPDCRLAP